MTQKNKDIDDLVLDALEALSLTNDEKNLIKEDATLLTTIWRGTSETVLVRYFKAIIAAQVAKAMHGDTASAKFLTDFVTPSDSNESVPTEPAKWEQLAIELRDASDLQCSAEELVVNILTALIRMPHLLPPLIPPA